MKQTTMLPLSLVCRAKCLVLGLLLLLAATHAFWLKGLPSTTRQTSKLLLHPSPHQTLITGQPSRPTHTATAYLSSFARRVAPSRSMVVAASGTEYLDNLPSRASKKGPPMQWGALGTWILATALQFATIVAFMYGMEKAFLRFNLSKQASIWLVRAFFAFMSLRSRVFSILDNSRPTVAMEDRKRRLRKRPSWMPPAKAFPVIWISIGVLRTIASSLVYETTNTLLSPALLAFVLHLSVGDTWNTITNVEDRQGASVPGVFLVWLSVVNAVRMYAQTLPLAGKVLAPSAVWITIANVLVISIWRLNGAEPLYPFKKRRE